MTKITKKKGFSKYKIIFATAMIFAAIAGYHVYAYNDVKTLRQNIETNNNKITEIQNAKEQLHITAELFRTQNLNDEAFTRILSDKWNELYAEETMLNDSNAQYSAEVEKINSRRIFKGRFELTAYCYGSRTATGTTPTANRTIAVDPRVIPYGTKVEIEGYGTYIAEDCGGAVKGNIIDIYIPGYNNCINFGRRYANVYIINE